MNGDLPDTPDAAWEILGAVWALSTLRRPIHAARR